MTAVSSFRAERRYDSLLDSGNSGTLYTADENSSQKEGQSKGFPLNGVSLSSGNLILLVVVDDDELVVDALVASLTLSLQENDGKGSPG